MLLALSLAACGGNGGGGSGPDGGTSDGSTDGGPLVPEEATGISTVAPQVVEAGQVVRVECALVDADGNLLPQPAPSAFQIDFDPEGAVQTDAEGRTVAAVAGEVTARCSAPSAGLVDEEPPTFTIVPGPPARVETSLDRYLVTAGETVTAQCAAWDAFDNPIGSGDLEATVVVDPRPPGTIVSGLDATLRQAGQYTALCEVPGADQVLGADFQVRPALPSALLLSPVPDQPFYTGGDVVELEAQALDRFGNVVETATVGFSVPGGGAVQQSDGVFEMANVSTETSVTLTGTITSPTQGGATVSASVQLQVRATGSAIRCVGPGDASMIDFPAGGTFGFLARATGDPVAAWVNGEPATLDEGSGSIEAQVPVRFGMNFVDVEIENLAGERHSRTCTFLASSNYGKEHGYLNDVIALELGQDAFDDQDPSDLDSFDDAIETAINSGEVERLLDDLLTAQNPLVDWEACFILCLRAKLEYIPGSLQIDGPHSTQLTLVDGGLRTRLTIRNVHLQFRVSGTCDGTIDVDVGSFTADVTFRIRSSGSGPRAYVQEVHAIQAGGFDIDFHLGTICDAIADVVDGFVNEGSLAEDFVGSFVEGELGGIIQDALSGFDLAALGGTLSVPRIDGNGSLDLQAGVRLSSLTTDPSQMLFGIGTQIRPLSRAHSRRSLGVAIPPGPVLLDPPTDSTTTAAVAANVALFNQALHALWRGGYFDVTLADAFPVDFPAGTTVELRTLLPPVASLEGNRMVIRMGAARAHAVIPSGPAPLDTGMDLDLGMSVSAPVVFDPAGPHLGIGAITVDELYVSVLGAGAVSMEARTEAEDLLQRAGQLALDTAVNGALPTFPLPTFDLGDGLAPFGVSGTLGMVDPAFDTVNGSHFVLRSGFGLMP